MGSTSRDALLWTNNEFHNLINQTTVRANVGTAIHDALPKLLINYNLIYKSLDTASKNKPITRLQTVCGLQSRDVTS